MSVLSRPRFYAQQRLDIEDLNSLLSALRSDSKAWNKNFLTSKNLIFKGFAVTGSATKQATIDISDAALVISQNTSDFSYYVSPNGATNIVLGDTLLQDNSRNYLEISIAYVDSTPASKAFLDTNIKQEFNQIVNTMTEVEISVEATTVGFSGNPNKIPLAIVDTDINGDIRVIFDRRELFGRLSTPLNYENNFNWGSKVEPAFSSILSSVTGTFEVGELIDIGSEQATVQTVGAGTITFIAPTGITFGIGSAVEGVVSGATATLDTAIESFTGVDKNITDTESLLKAIMTEIKAIKGTRFWYENTAYSLQSLISFSDAVIVQNTDSGNYSWDGSSLSITDNNVTPNSTDILAKLRRFGSLVDLDFTRQDGTGGSTVIAMADQQVLFTKIPLAGSRSFSGVGSADTNYQVVNLADFESTSESYWLAYREGTKLYIRGYGELETGESTPISDIDKETILKNINQDRSLKMIEGGIISLNLAGDELTLGSDAFIQIKGIDNTRNTIQAQTIVMPNPESVAFISISREAGALINKTVSVADYDTLLVNDNLLIIARKVSNGILVGTGTDLVSSGKKVTLDGAFSEIERYTDNLRLSVNTINRTRVNLSGTNKLNLDGSFNKITLNGRIIDPSFLGREFNVNTGEVFDLDGVTLLNTLIVPSVAASQWRWVSLTLVAFSVNADNTVIPRISAVFSNSDAATKILAQKPTLLNNGIHLGHFAIQRNAAGTAFENILDSDLIQNPVKVNGDPVADNSVTFEKINTQASDSSANFPVLNLQSINTSSTILSRTAAEANLWSSITFGNNLFVAIASNGTNRVMTSPDGITWTPQLAAEANQWLSVTFGDGLFVAVAQTGTNRVMTSTDGITWTPQLAAEANDWRGIAFGNGLFVAVCHFGINRVMTSTDGITWTPQLAAELNSWGSITFGNGLFVAVATLGENKVMTSQNGINWTPINVNDTHQWTSVTFGNDLFVAVGTGPDRIMTSPDGNTWTNRIASQFNSWSSVTFGNGLFVAVSSNGTNRVMTIDLLFNDSFFKSHELAPKTVTGTSLRIKNVLIKGAANLSLRIQRFFNPLTFTSRSASQANEWRALSFNERVIVAVAQTGISRVMTSPDGITWTPQLAAEANEWRSVTFGNGLFVAVAQTGTNRVMTSTGAGTVWTAQLASQLNPWQSVTFGDGLFVAVATTGTNRVMTSTDGITWNNRVAASAISWVSVTFGNGLFVAVSPTVGSQVMTSPDGINWTSRTASQVNAWNSVTFGNGLFVATATSGTNRVMISRDGINWINSLASEANQWLYVTYGNGLFVAVAIDGTNRVMTSPDGITWTPQLAAEANAWTGIIYVRSIFVAVSRTGTSRVMTAPLTFEDSLYIGE